MSCELGVPLELFDIGALRTNSLDFPTLFLKSGDELLCGRFPKPGKERQTFLNTTKKARL